MLKFMKDLQSVRTTPGPDRAREEPELHPTDPRLVRFSAPSTASHPVPRLPRLDRSLTPGPSDLLSSPARARRKSRWASWAAATW